MTEEHWKAFYFDNKPRLVHLYAGHFKMLCGYRISRYSQFEHWGKTGESLTCPKCIALENRLKTGMEK